MKRFIISRTDSLSNVVLTLPMVAMIKSSIPDSHIIFIGDKNSEPIVNSCSNIDKFISKDAIASLSFRKSLRMIKKLSADCIIICSPDKRISALAAFAGIKQRVGEAAFSYRMIFLNNIIKLNRKNSGLHDSQNNIFLLKKILPSFELPDLNVIGNMFGFIKKDEELQSISAYLSKTKKNIIIHPKNNGSVREWGLDNYSKLVQMLPYDKYNVIIAGSEIEARLMEGFLKLFRARAIDVTGKLSLNEYVQLISHSDLMISTGNGPLHIAAMTDIRTIGIYSPLKKNSPAKRAPLGPNSVCLSTDKDCNKCKRSDHCECIRTVSPQSVYNEIEKYFN